MADVMDEVSKETIQKLESIPSKLWQLFKALKQINDWNEQRKRADLKEIKDNYFDKLKELEKIEKELNEKYKAIYNEARESGDYKNILPETYQELKEQIQLNKKTGEQILTAGIRKDDMVPFFAEYLNEYEDVKLEDYIQDDGKINMFKAYHETHLGSEVIRPMYEEIENELNEKEKKIAIVKEAIFGTDTRYAIENFDGLLLSDPDKENVEEWLCKHFDNKTEAKNDIEIQVSDWAINLIEQSDIVITSEERDEVIKQITDDIYNYHEEQHENAINQRHDNLMNSIFKDEKATVPSTHFDNEIDIDER